MSKDEALKMAIETMESVWDKADFIKLAKSINACKEALEQPAPPEKTTSLEDVIKEFEKDPEMKVLLDLARKQVKGMELEQPALKDEKGRPMTYWGGLKQPAQEPVAWIQTFENQNGETKITFNPYPIGINDIAVYTHPHQWQGLTDDEKIKAFKANHCDDLEDAFMCGIQFAEVMLKEKNYVL